MDKSDVKELAVACGFELEPQVGGGADIDERVYTFVDELLRRVRHGNAMLNLAQATSLADVLQLVRVGVAHSNDMELERAVSILQDVQRDLISSAATTTDIELVGGDNTKDLPLHDPVNHPSHYTSHPSGVEAIEITRHMGFNLGNAVKYLWRNGLKDGQPAVQDLEKAVWYIQDEIKRIKEK